MPWLAPSESGRQSERHAGQSVASNRRGEDETTGQPGPFPDQRCSGSFPCADCSDDMQAQDCRDGQPPGEHAAAPRYARYGNAIHRRAAEADNTRIAPRRAAAQAAESPHRSWGRAPKGRASFKFKHRDQIQPFHVFLVFLSFFGGESPLIPFLGKFVKPSLKLRGNAEFKDLPGGIRGQNLRHRVQEAVKNRGRIHVGIIPRFQLQM